MKNICIWYHLWHRYLGDNPELYGSKITAEELVRLTSDGQQELIYSKVYSEGCLKK